MFEDTTNTPPPPQSGCEGIERKYLKKIIISEGPVRRSWRNNDYNIPGSYNIPLKEEAMTYPCCDMAVVSCSPCCRTSGET